MHLYYLVTGVCCQACNRDIVEMTFSGCIVHSKLLTPHQCSLLVMLMVDHVDTLFDVPSDVARIVHAHLHSSASTGDSLQSLCIFVLFENYFYFTVLTVYFSQRLHCSVCLCVY